MKILEIMKQEYTEEEILLEEYNYQNNDIYYRLIRTSDGVMMMIH